jgi:hypothetical protein
MSPLLGGPGRKADLVRTEPKNPPIPPTRKRILADGRIVRVPTWGAALESYEAEQPAPVEKVIYHGRVIYKRTRKRYLRPGRVRHARSHRPDGWVVLSVRVSMPELLDQRVRKLAVLDDRSISELIVLGLTWVVTEWAAKRMPPNGHWPRWWRSVEAYRNRFPRHRKETRTLPT